ncbi:MAG: Polyketide biosynthesis malonyl CoA-acyl carrier protein transacylase PksC [Verrucomicrobia subdivision 3 bacterium]|nr:Polyketide biosynthesis malonyl CoA-acyl carrier protein transacylase PksC [Limisphaerales bacterium]MCS1417633.1 Polyketide biosynthesis malonyl CoA-acyl carrier protein transacylase PksC [Limisphaerales bacterium]UWK15746.1 LasF [uncultured Verrucomicrobiota bacterium]UWK15767.1 LasF [uncultured Verrucomicrobiota bacterium]
MKRIFVFPGQGSQKKGMGQGLFQQFPEFTALADATLGYSIEQLCLEDPLNQLNNTAFTQPALYTVNCLSHLKEVAQSGLKPDFAAGHSLGEYSALFAAEAFDFTVGLNLVKKRGELMSQATEGAMAAILGLQPDKVRQLLKSPALADAHIANLNSPQQTVISGKPEALSQAKTIFESAGAQLFTPLKVSGAFHSPLMQKAAEAFAKYLEPFEFSPPKIPVIANTTAQPHRHEDIRKNLARQITLPVRWSEGIQLLLQQPDPQFSEIGPGKVLTGLIRQIQSAA